MSQRSFTIGLPEALAEEVARAAEAGGVSRNRFVREALERALVGGNKGGVPPGGPPKPASARASRADSFRGATQGGGR